MSEANKSQVGGNHYQKLKIQVWDYIVANDIPYLDGNVIRYVSRWRDKGGVKDLLKARHYIDKLIELEEARLKTGFYTIPGVEELLGTVECSAEEPPAAVPKIAVCPQNPRVCNCGSDDVCPVTGRLERDNCQFSELDVRGVRYERVPLAVVEPPKPATSDPSPEILVGPDDLCRCTGPKCLADGTPRSRGTCHVGWLDSQGVPFTRATAAK